LEIKITSGAEACSLHRCWGTLAAQALFLLIKVVSVWCPCQQAMSQPRYHPSPSNKLQYATYTLPQGSSIQLEVVKHPNSSKPSVACDLCGKLIEMTATGSLSYFLNTEAQSHARKRNKYSRLPQWPEKPRWFYKPWYVFVFIHSVLWSTFSFIRCPLTHIFICTFSFTPEWELEQTSTWCALPTHITTRTTVSTIHSNFTPLAINRWWWAIWFSYGRPSIILSHSWYWFISRVYRCACQMDSWVCVGYLSISSTWHLKSSLGANRLWGQ